jgi:UrcA family protein
MLTRTLSAVAALALTAGTLALSTPVHAAEAEQAVVAVAIGDLDLGRPGDVATLERRVRAAAREICGAMPTRGLREQGEVAGCQAQVVANARRDVELAIAGARPSGDSLALSAR